MNASDRRALKRIAKLDASRCKDGLLRLVEQFKPRFKKTMQKQREAKEKKERLGRKGATAAIRAAVFQRAGYRCEAWLPPIDDGPWSRCVHTASIWDHWLGGNGRRRQKQSVETTWALCFYCNRDRTEARPSADFWSASHGLHCRKHGYKFEPHIEHAKLSPDRRLPAVPLGPAVDPGVSSQTKEQSNG